MSEHKIIPAIGLRDFFKLLRGETHEILLSWMQKSTDMVRLPFLQNIYIIHSPEIAKNLLQKAHKEVDKENFLNKRLNQIFGQGIVASEGQLWLNERRLMQPAFHKERVRQILNEINYLIENQIDSWSDQASIRPELPHIPADLRRLTMQVVGRAIGFEKNSKLDAILDLMQKGAELVSNSIPINLPGWLPFTSLQKLKKMNARLEALLHQVIAENDWQQNPNSIIYMLSEGLSELDETHKNQLILDEVKSLLLSGIFTTSDSILWIIYSLEKHPEIKARFIESLKNNDSQYIQACINESLRLYPAVWSLWYHARQDLEVNNFKIPKDAVILINLYNIHRNPLHFADPEEYNPLRFLAEQPPAAFIPYGYGPRKCIGANLAHSFITEFVTRYYSSFQVEMLNNEMPSTVRITISQKENLSLKLTAIKKFS